MRTRTDLRVAFLSKTLFILMSSVIFFGALPLVAQPCVPVLKGTSFWAPLDENAGSPLQNIAKPTLNGFDVGNPQIYSGYVQPGQARRYDGLTQYSEFPNHSWLNPWEAGGEAFSLCCWVNVLAGGDVSGIRVILDKRVFVGGSVRGFTLFMDGGYLGCQIADGTYSNYIAYFPSHQIVPNNQWRFVAMSVHRTQGSGYLRVDNSQWNFNPSNHQGSLVTSAPLRIGASSDATPGSHFSGIIDEVALCQKWLSFSDFDPVFTASPQGVAGMCKSQCVIYHAPGFPTLASNCNWFQARIWNNLVYPQTYNTSFQAVAANQVSGCTINGPTQITPATGSLYVPPFSYADIGVLVNRPVGLGYACVRLQASSGGNTISDTASFWVNNGSLTAGAPCVYIPTPLMKAGVNQLGTTSFTLGNESTMPLAVGYQLAVIAPDGSMDTDTVSLNDQPPGTAIVNLITIQPVGTQPILVSARFLKSDALKDYTIALLVDSGGVFETIASIGLRDERPEGLFTEVLTPEDGVVTIEISGAPIGSAVFSFLTLSPGAFPNGWFFGLDISFAELFNQYSFGLIGIPPFGLPLGPSGTAHWSVNGLPPGIAVQGVSIGVDPQSLPVQQSNLFPFQTR